MHKKILLAVLIAAACGSAQADPEFKVSGFGTLGMTHSDNHDADFIKGLAASGVGKSRATDLALDTMGAVQLDGKIDSHWSAVVQVVSERNADNNFDPRVEWANIKYAFSPDFSMRLGRVGLPVFMVSDYRLVGYANPWVRGPVEVYNLVPISSGDGLDMAYRVQMGDAAINFQAAYTKAKFKFPEAAGSETGKLKDQISLAAVYENGPLSLRLGYSQAKLDLQPNRLLPLVSGLQTIVGLNIPVISVPAANLLNEAASREADASFSGIGATYDSGTILLQGEYVQRRANKGLIPGVDAAYILGGVRFGNLMPYALCSADKARPPYTNANANSLVASGTAFGSADLIALGQGVQGLYSSRYVSQSTLALGVRYDFMKNMALKAQFDHIRPDGGAVSGSYPTSVNKTNLLTLNLDFVF